jgi:outer membrane protein OmpA-like peptidoglycan-associated protein
MNGLGKVFVACIGGLSLAGCGMQLEKAESLSPQGSAFDVNLYEGYLGLAKSETGEGDHVDSDVFATRAISAGSGTATGPEAIAARDLPKDKVGELSTARERLVAALASGAAQKMPADSADAQVKFDCWMQEQEENFQPDDIAACRGGFYDALAKLESGTKAVAKVAPAPEPQPEPKLGALKFVVYFDTDSADLDAAAKAVLAEAEAAAAKAKAAKVSVLGNTDTVGEAAYNDTLSELRAAAVAKAMVAGGVPAGAISSAAFGESNLAKPTGDNVSAGENRRVEIVIEQ